MWALVESNNITEIIRNPKGISIGDVQYPSSIFTMWSSDELKAVGLYPVTMDNTNFKDASGYINTEITYTVSGSEVVGAYGSATARPLADALFTAQDETDGLGTEGEVKSRGLKSLEKEKVNGTASSMLEPTDWYALRAADGGTAVPSNIATYRAAVRTKANTHHAAIDGASDVDALIALEYDWPTAP